MTNEAKLSLVQKSTSHDKEPKVGFLGNRLSNSISATSDINVKIPEKKEVLTGPAREI